MKKTALILSLLLSGINISYAGANDRCFVDCKSMFSDRKLLNACDSGCNDHYMDSTKNAEELCRNSYSNKHYSLGSACMKGVNFYSMQKR